MSACGRPVQNDLTKQCIAAPNYTVSEEVVNGPKPQGGAGGVLRIRHMYVLD